MAGFDIKSTATNLATDLSKKLTDSGLAKDLSSATGINAAQLQSLSNKVPGQAAALARNQLGGLTVDLSKELGAPSMISAALPSDGLPPYPNPLIIFSSYTYIFTLSCLDDYQINNPDTTYRAGKPHYVICKSANGDPFNRIQTAYGKFDFFIDNMVMETNFGFEKATGVTNLRKLDFTIIEPYSMGLFAQACAVAARDTGHQGYVDAPYMLTIEFRGFTEQNETVDLPQLKKYLPIKITKMGMKVTGKGATYKIEAIPWNDQAFSDQYTKAKTDLSISGKTVQEVLQTGEKSLQVVMNNFYQQKKADKLVDVADEILILFPKDIATSKDSSSKSAPESKTSATANPNSSTSPNAIYQKLGVVRSSLTSGKTTLVQDAAECNAIGKSSLGFSAERKGDPSYGKDAGSYDEKTKTFVQGNIKVDPAVGEFKFRQDSDIVNAITQVILQSDYARQALKGEMIDQNGMLPWWRIETQMFNISSDENLDKTGTKPKLIVYRVVPYKAHSSKIMPANQPAPGFQNLKNQAVKEYNYIYTGKNTDVLDFDIDIKTGFFTVYGADNNKNNQDKKEQANNSSTKTEKPAETPPPSGQSTILLGSLGTKTAAVGTSTRTDGQGGGGPESSATRVGRQFHDMLTTGFDMTNIDLKIIGDPYFIADSGMGNYTAQNTTGLSNINNDGSANYQANEVDMIVNFRSPVDINQSAGMYDFGDSVLLLSYSGLYKIKSITNNFQGGKFTQVIHAYRRPLQEVAASNPEVANQARDKVASPTPTISATNSNILAALGNSNNVNNLVQKIAPGISNAASKVGAPSLPGIVNSGGVSI